MKEKMEKMIFVPSGSLIEYAKKGIDIKEAIELLGYDAGEFVPEHTLTEADKKAVKEIA